MASICLMTAEAGSVALVVCASSAGRSLVGRTRGTGRSVPVRRGSFQISRSKPSVFPIRYLSPPALPRSLACHLTCSASTSNCQNRFTIFPANSATCNSSDSRLEIIVRLIHWRGGLGSTSCTSTFGSFPVASYPPNSAGPSVSDIAFGYPGRSVTPSSDPITPGGLCLRRAVPALLRCGRLRSHRSWNARSES